MYTIYLWTNLVNNKGYVGQTINLAARKKQHLSSARTGKKWCISRAIRKYGANNFDLQNIAEVATSEEANNLEKTWVNLLQTNDKRFGYNATSDGQGYSGGDNGERKRENDRLREAGLYKRQLRRPDINDEDVARLYNSGLTLHAVGKQLGCNRAVIYYRLRQLGIPRRGRYDYAVTDSRREKNRQGRLGKRHSPESTEKIKAAKKGLNAQEKSCRWRHDIPNGEIARLYEGGLSTPAIGKLFKCSASHINKRLKNHGIVTRKSGWKWTKQANQGTACS